MTTLLIVEDNEMNVDMLSQRLKRKGFQITVAMDGEKGIKLATETFPQLILMVAEKQSGYSSYSHHRFVSPCNGGGS